jgi:hypothetical protein
LSAASKPEPAWAFSHAFTTVDPDNTLCPNDMSVKEAKSLPGIHKLLMAPLSGLGNDGSMIDQREFDASVLDLSK